LSPEQYDEVSMFITSKTQKKYVRVGHIYYNLTCLGEISSNSRVDTNECFSYYFPKVDYASLERTYADMLLTLVMHLQPYERFAFA